MARKYQEIDQEIRRIEGQLLVAKQICRENLKEINHLKRQQENDPILQETNYLLSLESLDSTEHADRFNRLLHLINEKQKRQTTTIQCNKQDDQNNSLLVDLSLNISELESLFDYAKTLFTQPITSVNMLNNTVSFPEITGDLPNDPSKQQDSIQLNDLQQRIDTMHKILTNFDQYDDCFIQ